MKQTASRMTLCKVVLISLIVCLCRWLSGRTPVTARLQLVVKFEHHLAGSIVAVDESANPHAEPACNKRASGVVLVLDHVLHSDTRLPRPGHYLHTFQMQQDPLNRWRLTSEKS